MTTKLLHKTLNLNLSKRLGLRVLWITFLSLFLSLQSFGQSFILDLQYNPMSFKFANKTILVNNGNTGSIQGTGLNSVHKYSNVITISGITVYAKLTILAIHNATITNFDDDGITGEPTRFQPRIGTNHSDGCYVTYQLEFFDTRTDYPVYIYNYYMTVIDNDGNGSNREYVDVGGYSSYNISSTCGLTFPDVHVEGRTRFLGIGSSLPGVTFDNTASFIANYLNANNRITFTLGQTGSNSERYYSVQFGAKGGTLTNPSTVNNPLPVAVNDDGTVNYFTSGSPVVAIPNVFSNDIYNGVTIVPSQFTITKLTNPSNAGVVFDPATGKVTVAPGTPGGTYTFTYQLSLNAAPANVDIATVTVKVLQADLGITKSVTPGTVVAGQNVSYTITVTNAGPTDAQSVSVADPISSNLTTVTTSPSVGTWLASNWTIGTLLSGTSATLTINAKVLATYSGTLANSATVTSTTPDPSSGNNTANANLIVTALSGPNATNDAATTPLNTTNTNITILGNDTPGSGGAIAPATVIVGTQPLASVGGFTVNSSGVVTFTPATGYVGPATITYTVKDVSGISSNQATITCTVTGADLEITKTAALSVVGTDQFVTYTLTAKNNGPNDAASVSVSDPVPANVTYSSATTPSVGTWVSPTWTIGTLANGSSATLTIKDKLNTEFTGTLSNTATITSTTGDPVSSNNTFTLPTSVTALTGPSTTDDNATTEVGAPVTIHVLDNDHSGSTPIDVTKVTFVGTIPSTSTVGTFTVDNLGVVTFIPVASFTGSTTIKYNVVDGNNLSAQATITCTINKADLVITKTAALSIVGADQFVTYTLTAHNNGLNSALAVSVSDPAPANTTYSSAGTPSQGTWDQATSKWSVGTLTNGANATITITDKLNTGYTGNISNTATISSTTNDPTSSNNSSTVTTPVTALTGPVAADDNFSTNINTANSMNVLTNDTHGTGLFNPATVAFVSGTAPLASVGVFTVDNAGLVTFTPATGYIGSATIKYTVTDLNSLTSNQATITCTILKADLAITKTAAISFDGGNQLVTYTIKVINGGPDEAKAVVATDVLPTSLTVNSATTLTGTWTAPTWTIGNLANGASATLTIVAKVGVVEAGSLSNTATVTSSIADPVLTNNTATVTSTTASGPHAVDDIVSTTVNTTIPIIVLTNDTQGSSPIVVTSVTLVPGTEPAATIGVFTVNPATGIVTFVPASGYLGTTTITYQILDGNGLSSQATITVTVTPSLINNFPSTGFATLAFEDLWPAKGDYDMNDLVLDYKFQITTNANNFVEKVVGTFVIKAFGASFENGFGFQLPGIANANDLTVTGYSLTDGYINLNNNGTEIGQTKPTIIVYDNAFKQMTSPGGIGVNTDPNRPYVTPKTLTITINVKPNTYSYSDLDISNFNPFLIVNKVRGVEVHLPNYAPTSLANPSLFGTGDDNSIPAQNKYYKTANNLPWAINTYEQFDYPKEKIDISQVFIHFAVWATSGGTSFTDWYKDLSGYRNAGSIYPIHH